MIVNFTLYRSKYPDEEIITDSIEYPIKDTILISLDTFINKIIINYAYKIDIISKYGIAYIGTIKLNSIEINNKDDIELNEEGFKSFINQFFTNVNVIWNKSIKVQD